MYRILGESAAQSRLDVVGTSGLTPLVGRDSEVILLLERWAQRQSGAGQVVFLRGEAYEKGGRVEEGLSVLAEALAVVHKTGGADLRSRAVSPERRVAAGTVDAPDSGGRSLFSSGPQYRPLPAGEIVGATSRYEPGSPVATPRQTERSSPTARRALRLVHRGL
jgi:hypothetical protein